MDPKGTLYHSHLGEGDTLLGWGWREWWWWQRLLVTENTLGEVLWLRLWPLCDLTALRLMHQSQQLPQLVLALPLKLPHDAVEVLLSLPQLLVELQPVLQAERGRARRG